MASEEVGGGGGAGITIGHREMWSSPDPLLTHKTPFHVLVVAGAGVLGAALAMPRHDASDEGDAQPDVADDGPHLTLASTFVFFLLFVFVFVVVAAAAEGAFERLLEGEPAHGAAPGQAACSVAN